MTYSVYKLIDSRTKEVKYVGKTTRTLVQRLTQHVASRSESGTPLQKWLHEAYLHGAQTIQIALIETAKNWNQLNKKEYFHIKDISRTSSLLNLSIPDQPNKSGRKKLPEGEKRVPITFSVSRKYVDAQGGEEKAREVALKAIENISL